MNECATTAEKVMHSLHYINPSANGLKRLKYACTDWRKVFERLKLIVFHNVHIEIDVVLYICNLSCLFKSVVVKVFLGKL